MQHDLNTQEKNNSLEVDTELESRAGSLFSGSESNNSEVQDGSLFCEKDSSQANQGAKKMRNSTCSHSSIPVDCFALDSQLGEAEKIVTQTNSIEAPTESTSLSLDIGPNLLENQTFNPIGFFDPLQMDLAGLFGSGQPIETVQEIPAGLEEFDASSEIFSWLNFIEDLSTWDGNPETSSIPINYLPPSLITTQGVEHASENQSLTPTALYTSTSDQILITAPHLLTPPSAEPQAGSSGDGGYTGGDDVISSSLPPLALPKKPLKVGNNSASATEKARREHKNPLISLIKAPAVKLFPKIGTKKPNQSSSKFTLPTTTANQFTLPTAPTNQFTLPAAPTNQFTLPTAPTYQFTLPTAPTSQFTLPTAPNPKLSTTQVVEEALVVSESRQRESVSVSGNLNTSILQQLEVGEHPSSSTNKLTKTKAVNNLSATKKAVKDHKDKSRSTIKDDDDPKKDKKRRDKTGEKAICPVCSKELSARGSNMKRHINSAHSGAKFSCPFCVEELKYPGDVKRHIKSKHPDALKEKSGSTNIDPNLR
ncbi:expressed protein [Phakopsora pachyrhizi]|uniref:Expressed protein n=1 Tax=Phakopsora pachyrhizi TaxID=170000 RepID=A0AAV0BTZ6_PHAPC|nr:expressed protein [Phakopsora pachyrhizi]